MQGLTITSIIDADKCRLLFHIYVCQSQSIVKSGSKCVPEVHVGDGLTIAATCITDAVKQLSCKIWTYHTTTGMVLASKPKAHSVIT